MLDNGLKAQPEPCLELIADQLRVDRDQLDEVVDNWSKDKFLDHCSKLRAADLKPPAVRRGAPGARPPRPR